jgi:hypothetical protein
LVQKLIHCDGGNLGGESDDDRTGVPITHDISGTAVMPISLGVAPTHSLIEHSLWADELPANLAGVPWLRNGDAAIEAIVAPLVIRIDQNAEVDHWDQTKNEPGG